MEYELKTIDVKTVLNGLHIEPRSYQLDRENIREGLKKYLEVFLMKSLAELEAIREKAQKEISLRDQENKIRVVVGMATCGITGARLL